jgi:hypothetical protein
MPLAYHGPLLSDASPPSGENGLFLWLSPIEVNHTGRSTRTSPVLAAGPRRLRLAESRQPDRSAWMAAGTARRDRLERAHSQRRMRWGCDEADSRRYLCPVSQRLAAWRCRPRRIGKRTSQPPKLRQVGAVSRQLGHANPTITLSTYAHLFERADHAAAAREALEASYATPANSTTP